MSAGVCVTEDSHHWLGINYVSHHYPSAVSTVYHPRMDGQSERSNQWLEQYLWFWVDHQQTNWHHYLPLVEFVHNSWKNESTGQYPFEVLMGYHPRAEIFNVTLSIPTIALQLRDWKKA